MNGDERQGDANPISNREKRNAAARDLRVQSQVHLVMPPNLISSARDKGKSEGRDPLGEESSTGTVHPERRLYSIRTEAGGRRRESRRGRAELPQSCSPPAMAVERRGGTEPGGSPHPGDDDIRRHSQGAAPAD